MLTAEEYINLGGIEVESGKLERLIKRAERDIDRVTGGNLDFDKLSEKQQKYVKYAVLSQVEFLATNGETISVVGGEYDSVTIGSFSMSKGTRAGARVSESLRYAPAMIEYLHLAGVIYTAARLI